MKYEFTASLCRCDRTKNPPMCFASGMLVNPIQLPCSGIISIPLPIEEWEKVKNINGINPIMVKVTVESLEIKK